MARAYATFASRGQRPDPLAITKVVTSSGQVMVDQAPRGEHVLDPNVADTVTSVLTGVLGHGTASGKGIGRPAAGKTGTTDKLTDAWFVGYTPQLSTAVWMGYTTDPKTGQTPAMTGVHGIQVSGGTLPATIWQKFMKSAVAPMPVATFNVPSVSGRVVGPAGAPCANGMLPTPDNPCLPPGSLCPAASASPAVPAVPSPTPSKGAGTPAASPSATAKGAPPAASPSAPAAPAPCPSPSEALPSDIVIPSPSPSPGSSPGASPAGSPSPGGHGGH